MSNSTTIKSLPAGLLSPVAFIYKSGEDIDDETGAIRADYQYQVFDKDAFDSAYIPSHTYCDCCGQPLKYSCLFKHAATGAIYFVGRDCAATIEGLKSSFLAGLDKISISLALRAKCNAREQAFLIANPAAEEAFVWGKAGQNRIAKDICDKIRSYGNPSDKQVALLVKIHAEETARRANATGTVPTGRVRASGTVVSVKVEYSDIYSSWSCKLVVDLGGGIRVWGNGGTACIDGDAKALVEKGDRIEFTAAFTTSDRDPLFGFFKRPTKVTIHKQNP